MYKIFDKLINFIEKIMKNRRVEQIARGKNQRGIFQRDILSLLLFVTTMMPFNHLLRKYTGAYKLTKS